MFPIQNTEDIVTRGMWDGKVVHEKALDGLPWYTRWGSRLLTDILGAHLIVKDTRAPIPSFISTWGESGAKVRQPDYVYPKFMLLSKTHWLLRTIFRAVTGEVLTPGVSREPRFKKKCSNCGNEYQNPDVEKCEICGGTDFDKPDVDQYKLFRQLMGEDRENHHSLVGEGRTFREFLFSTLWYLLALDDFYWEIGHTHAVDPNTQKIVRVPRGVRVLDGAITQPVMDEFGNFTSPEYFCPTCYKEAQRANRFDDYVDIRSEPQGTKPSQLKCTKCGGALLQTAYIQKVDGKVVTRFGKDEVIHASSSRIDPEAFGLSKIIAAVNLLYVIDYMDQYNLQIYGHGHASQLLGIEGADKQTVETIKESVLNQLRGRTRQDPRTGEVDRSLEPVLIFIGLEQGKNIIPVDISPKLDEMQSIEYYRLYVEKTCGLFGVSPVFVNISEPGATAFTARPRIDVQNRVTRQNMSDIEDPFNDFLLPKLGITDWCLRFGNIESRDELRDKQIVSQNMHAVSLAIKAGFAVTVSEDVRSFTISPKPVREPEARSREEAGRDPQELGGAPTRTMPDGSETGTPLMEPEDVE